MRHRQLTGRAGSPGQRGVGPDAQAEANRLGIAILGHLPAGVDTVRAACLGMRSVEHLGPGVGILSCCSTDEERVRGAAKGRSLPTGSGPDAAAFMTEVLAQLVINPVNSNTPDDKANLAHALDTFSDERVKELAAVFSETSTWQVPTLVRLLSEQLCDDEAFPVDPDLRCIAPSVVESWQRAADTLARFTDADRATLRRAYQRHLDITRTFAAAGVPMLTGTDSSGAAWVVPGAALHREFDELTRAGVPPLRVLQMTALNAAEYLGEEERMGTVSVGRASDLVLLRGNPVEDAAQLHEVEAMVRAGRHYCADDLHRIRERIASAHSGWPSAAAPRAPHLRPGAPAQVVGTLSTG